MKQMFTEETVLIGDHVKLEPLQNYHREALSEVITNGELWKLWYTLIPHPDKLKEWIEKALTKKLQQTDLPFVVRLVKNGVVGEIIGSTRLLNIDKVNNRLEIGSTFYAINHQKTIVNTESKFLLLSYIFEQLQCTAVEFRTHYMNQKSRNAIMRLGAKQDGILRNHMLMPDGTYRDTVIYSILNSEWAVVKTNLLYKLGKLN